MIEHIAPFVLGGVAHILLTLIEEGRKLGKPISIKCYQNLHPYQLPLSLVMSVLAFWIFAEINQLNVISAISAGYMGDSLTKKFLNSKGMIK